MRNVIEILGERLADAAKDIESRLMEKYAIKSFRIGIFSETFRYNVDCIDVVNDFCCARNDELTVAVEELEKQLTPKNVAYKRKMAKAKQLMEEADTER